MGRLAEQLRADVENAGVAAKLRICESAMTNSQIRGIRSDHLNFTWTVWYGSYAPRVCRTACWHATMKESPLFRTRRCTPMQACWPTT